MALVPLKTLKYNSDPFTDLPDCIIHHILSFIDTNNVVTMRSVSKRFMKVCLTSPYLSFISKTCPPHGRPYRNQHYNDLGDFLDKFFSDRCSDDDDASMDIIRMHVECTCRPCQFTSRKPWHDWIYDAFKLNVQEVDFKLHMTIPISMLNNCKSLTVLKLSCCYTYSPGIVFPLVRILSLKGGYMNEDDDYSRNNEDDDRIGLFEWISNSFPSLKKLCLGKVRNEKFIFESSTIEELKVSIRKTYTQELCNLTNISMQNLESLTLEFPADYYCRTKNCIVRITAPKLRDFKIKAYFLDCKFEAEFLHLRKASFDVPDNCNYLVALHRSITVATSLEINILSLETLLKNDDCRQIMRENLHYLILNVDEEYSKDDEYIQSLISYLKLFHNIKSLTIKHPPLAKIYCRGDFRRDLEIYTGNMKLDESKKLKLFQSLKEIVMKICTGTKEIELLKYLLKYAESLEKATLLYASHLTDMVSCIDFRNFVRARTSLKLSVEHKDFSCEEEDN